MLKHINEQAVKPQRVVIMGCNGFVGAALKRKLENESINCLALSRSDVDLLAVDAADKLAKLLQDGDTFVAVSAIAPVKNSDMLKDNITMIEAISQAVGGIKLGQFINIGSDAIYADSEQPLTENSCEAPGSLHGAMHLLREIMFHEAVGQAPYASLRPTLIYGLDDPHNGYGPNRFRRLAAEGKEIHLFGNGEERRDHVWIEDVAELLKMIILHRSEGVLNAATGEVISFKEIAEAVVEQFENNVDIVSTPRSGPMPHNGYRPFDPACTYNAFPGFKYTNFATGLDNMLKSI